MNEEKEIEDMASALTGEVINNGDRLVKLGYIETKAIAELLVNAGHGDVKQAVKEFADELRKRFCVRYPTFSCDAVYEFTEGALADLIEEIYGE